MQHGLHIHQNAGPRLDALGRHMPSDHFQFMVRRSDSSDDDLPRQQTGFLNRANFGRRNSSSSDDEPRPPSRSLGGNDDAHQVPPIRRSPASFQSHRDDIDDPLLGRNLIPELRRGGAVHLDEGHPIRGSGRLPDMGHLDDVGHLGGLRYGRDRYDDDDDDIMHRMPRGMGMGIGRHPPDLDTGMRHHGGDFDMGMRHHGGDFDMGMGMRHHGGGFGMGMPMERDKVVLKFGKPTSVEEVLPFYDVELNVA
jgi:hypothetical protein